MTAMTPSPTTVTIVICARNASGTIARAVASAAPEPCRILLVDDWSTDDTVACARAVAPIEVVVPARHGTVAQARQAGLDAVRTPFLLWLDADDECLPGRVARLVDVLQRTDGDIASDGVELADGADGARRGVAAIPSFVRRAPVRLFERMYLPGPGVIAARTAVARAIGYDPALHGGEDTDFLLRGLARGARVRLQEEAGYRLYAYPASLSRDRDRQRRMYRQALRKHAYGDVEVLYDAAGVRREITVWALVSIAMFREDHASALTFVDRAERLCAAPDAILEPDGPCRCPERWRVAFYRGTARLLLGDVEGASAELRSAREVQDSAEVLNNLGIACLRLGARAEGVALFEQALDRYAGYADARDNLTAAMPTRVTTHPLRIEAARQDYGSARRCD